MVIVQLLHRRSGTLSVVTTALDFAVLLNRELTLFAAVGFLVGGVGDVAIDVVWIVHSLWRRATVYRRHARADASSLPLSLDPSPIAIFVPAWDEAAVIAPMLNRAVALWGDQKWRIFVGTYPNDPATIAAVASVGSSRIRLVTGDVPGPTTKADCLNRLWQAMIAEEAWGQRFKAVVLHDAEDAVHADELRVFDALTERFDLVQLPVVPLIDRESRWIGGHYLDEFAEDHGKTLVAREAIGAAVPAAGVGCAFSRDMLGCIAGLRNGAPFDEDSLTEDYELGMRVRAYGGRGIFVRIPARVGGGLVAVRAHFPSTLEAAVKQKARWIAGIALSGWDRLGWSANWADSWMRIHDRRAPFAAMILLAAYSAFVLNAVLLVAGLFTDRIVAEPSTPLIAALLTICLALLGWRMLVRAFFVSRQYGLREGLRAIPRMVVGNLVAMMAARRAVGLYLRMRRDGTVRWDKTAHRFPSGADLV
jgi:bacteriophage N4 adsorption protein B